MSARGDLRLCVGFVGHPKTRQLCRRLGADAVLSLLELWEFAALYREDGRLTGLDAAGIADAARIDRWGGSPEAFVEALLAPLPGGDAGFLERSPGGAGGSTFVLHDWTEIQEWIVGAPARRAASRVANEARWSRLLDEDRSRRSGRSPSESGRTVVERMGNGSRNANGVRNGDAGNPGSDPDSDPDSGFDPPFLPSPSPPLPKPKRRRRAKDRPPYSEFPGFEKFWLRFPRKEGKGTALDAWIELRLEGRDEYVDDGLSRWEASKVWNDESIPYSKRYPHPATFLRAGRLDDEPRPAGRSEEADRRPAGRGPNRALTDEEKVAIREGRLRAEDLR